MPPTTTRLKALSPLRLSAGRGAISVRIPAAQHLERRAREDEEIETDGTVLRVPEIEVDALLHQVERRRAAAIAAHLRPAGDAGLHRLAAVIFGDQRGIE